MDTQQTNALTEPRALAEQVLDVMVGVQHGMALRVLMSVFVSLAKHYPCCAPAAAADARLAAAEIEACIAPTGAHRTH